MSVDVQVFGRRHDNLFDALLRPASKKRQGTKSRRVGHRGLDEVQLKQAVLASRFSVSDPERTLSLPLLPSSPFSPRSRLE
jgi:hypothetical protein